MRSASRDHYMNNDGKNNCGCCTWCCWIGIFMCFSFCTIVAVTNFQNFSYLFDTDRYLFEENYLD